MLMLIAFITEGVGCSRRLLLSVRRHASVYLVLFYFILQPASTAHRGVTVSTPADATLATDSLAAPSAWPR